MKSKKVAFVALFVIVLAMMPVLAHAQKMEISSAKIYLRENPPKLDKAENLLKTALEKDPGNNNAHYFLGMVYYYKGNFDLYFDNWDHVVYKDLGKKEKKQYKNQLGDIIRLRYNAATQSYDKREFANAVGQFQTSIRASEMLQKGLRATGKKKEMQEADSLEETRQLSYLFMGYAALSAQDYDIAVIALEQVLEADPNKVEAWDGLINIYYRQENHEKLILACNKTIELSEQTDLTTYLMLRNAYFATADTTNVMATYEKAIEAHPMETSLYRDLSSMYGSKKEYARAITLLEKGRANIPDNLVILNYLGTVYYNQGFTLNEEGDSAGANMAFSNGVAPLEKLLEIEPLSIDGNDTLAKIYHGLAKTERDDTKKSELAAKGDAYGDKKRELIMSGEGK
ncbi:MAG: tetratricopeptide repeat protein [Gemmatimonadota bacterium]|nr:tetratricopeptide repeat protein [Gemmatimonadota bacterium]